MSDGAGHLADWMIRQNMRMRRHYAAIIARIDLDLAEWRKVLAKQHRHPVTSIEPEDEDQ